jgi:hypothetical protein
MSVEKPEDDIETQFYSLDTETNEEILEDAEQNMAFMLASQVIEYTDAGFAIIGSPHMHYSDLGQPFPESIGISINANTALTKSTLAPVLRLLADNLEAETNRIQDFLREATTNE